MFVTVESLNENLNCLSQNVLLYSSLLVLLFLQQSQPLYKLWYKYQHSLNCSITMAKLLSLHIHGGRLNVKIIKHKNMMFFGAKLRLQDGFNGPWYRFYQFLEHYWIDLIWRGLIYLLWHCNIQSCLFLPYFSVRSQLYTFLLRKKRSGNHSHNCGRQGSSDNLGVQEKSRWATIVLRW